MKSVGSAPTLQVIIPYFQEKNEGGGLVGWQKVQTACPPIAGCREGDAYGAVNLSTGHTGLSGKKQDAASRPYIFATRAVFHAIYLAEATGFRDAPHRVPSYENNRMLFHHRHVYPTTNKHLFPLASASTTFPQHTAQRFSRCSFKHERQKLRLTAAV